MKWTVIADLATTIAIAVFSGLLWFVTKRAADAAKKAADAAKKSADTAGAEYLLARRSDVYLEWSRLARNEKGLWVIAFGVKANVLTTISSVAVTHSFARSGEPRYTGDPGSTGKASPHRGVAVHWSISPPQQVEALAVDVAITYIDAASGDEDSTTFRRCYTRIGDNEFRAGDEFDEGERESLKEY